MKNIFEIEELEKLEAYLREQNIDEIRKKLIAVFFKYSDYKNATEWNKAVRLCECLAIIGWGKYEPVQAVLGVFYNGNPETIFYNKFGEPRFVDAIWSKRKAGCTMENGRAFYHFSPDIPQKPTDGEYFVKEEIQDIPLNDQRNWILKNPILITRGISNCYKSSKAVIESIEKDLQATLNLKMRPELYGKNTIERLIFTCSYSYYDNDCCKTNHIIADEKLNLKQKDFYPQLLKMYSKSEIEKNGYYLRNRYEYGNFKSGRMNVHINFEKELSDLNFVAQKEKIGYHIEEALNTIIGKLKKKKLNYDFELMQSDFLKILSEWKQKNYT